MLTVAGVTAIETRILVAATTARDAVPLTPFKVAVIVDVPAATAVATPAALMVAVTVLELLHVTELVITAVEPSL